MEFTINPFAIGTGLDATITSGSGTSTGSTMVITQTLIVGVTTVTHNAGLACKFVSVLYNNAYNALPFENPSGSTTQVNLTNAGPEMTNATIILFF
ncbi:MAG: hypothetical protein PHS93_09225 [Candidatus Omnitrophica bacterium]|nr:hypothetical protein [Candidatus Omnitrophota bacterium]MDD5353327.1 hypothetical protein [Candidatus Omnitrophota bacterium]MDD5551405.1 hypothetical protein [Candidatus Omnitrophota bacterium]